jgi:hypothetical protein
VAEPGRLRHPTIWHYAACYALYAVVLALCYGAFWTWRSAIEVVLSFLLRHSTAFGLLYLSATLLVGLALFAVAMAGEGYLRSSIRRGSLRRLGNRFARLAVPLAIAMGVAIVLQELVYKRVGL